MTRSQLWLLTVLFYLGDGEAFWVLDRSVLGTINRIIPKSFRGFEEIVTNGEITGWRFDGELWRTLRGTTHKSKAYNLNEITRFYMPHPLDHFRGMAPSAAARSEIKQGVLADLFNEAFFENGAEAAMYFTTKASMTPDQKGEFLKHLDQRMRGPQNRGKNAILDNGINPIPGATHRDMEFVDQKKWERDTVLAIYGTSRSIIGGQEGEVNRSTFSEAKRQYFELTIIPELVYFSELITKDLVTEPDVLAVFDTGLVEGLRGSTLEIADAAATFLGAGFTRNEVNARYELGFENQPWGDEAFGNGALVPYSNLLEAQPSNNTGNVAAEPESPVTNPEGSNISASLNVIDLEKAAKKEFKWKTFAKNHFFPHEQEFLTSYLKVLSRLEKEQLSSLRSASSRKTFDPSDLEIILFAQQQWENHFRGVANGIGPTVAQSALSSVENELGGMFSFSLVDPKVLQAIEGSAENLVGVTVGIRERVRAQLLRGLANGETLPQIEARVSSLFQLERGRALTIARTEVAQVLSSVRFDGMEAEGVTKKIWSTAADEVVRDSHKVFGRAARKDLDFNYMQLVAGGGTLQHPSDPRGPARQVVNCRCVLLAGV
jgi:phage portal protein BeeE